MAGGLKQSVKERLFNRGLALVPHQRCDIRPLSGPDILDVATIAFNNSITIKYQIRLLRKNLQDDFAYTVVDNSNDPNVRRDISQLCTEQGVAYISLPPNPFTGPSQNHGAALNWVYKHYFSPRAAAYFGFLDHDIFPIKPTTLLPLIRKHHLVGHPQQREKQWYLWAGFCFFERDFVKDKELNFMPIAGLDSGGGNWPALYAHFDPATLNQFTHTYEKLREGSDPQADMIEHIGDWVHTINASNWKGVASKDSLVEQLLSRY